VSPTATSLLAGARVVLVNWRDPWHRRAGGSERFAWEFALALVDGGADVEFWTARDRGQLARGEQDGIRVRRRGGTYSFYGRALVGLLWARLRRRAPDLVVDMDCGIPVFTPLVLAPRTPVVLVVHHVHQRQFLMAMPQPLATLGRVLERRLMPRVYRGLPTVAVSESTVTEMREQLDWEGEVRVVHNVTAPSDVDAPGRWATPGEERVVILGRVVPHKRVDLVLRALARVIPGRPGLVADVFGTGPGLPAVTAVVAELGIGDAVRVHGFVPEDEKYAALTGARLHVCASDGEGWGLVVLEAAANGVPTLARDVPGVRDSVRDGVTGWLLAEPADDTSEALVARLAAGIVDALELMSDPAVRERAARDCRNWASGFGWERMHHEARDAVVAALEGRR
jgi:glycosyltransferase involved in cell wall biosynthesis